jgi:hypothetical protein
VSTARLLVITAEQYHSPDLQEHAWDPGADPELCLYRNRTIWLLRRYMRLSVEVGRLPSLLGRELFRSKAVSYRSAAFEDVVIFVHDIESSLAKLDVFSQSLIARVVLQEYTQDETAELLHCNRRTVGRYLPEALDQLSAILLREGLMRALPGSAEAQNETCQEGKSDKNFATLSCETK